jgi:hypothetical protein
VEAVFPIVLFAIVGLGVLGAVISLVAGRGAYDEIGSGDFSMDTPEFEPGPAPGTPAARAESEAEVRQMLEAKSERRQRRGEAPLDVDAELAKLMSAGPPPPRRGPAPDDPLREEVRQLVVARNERRERRGQEPLEVEAEVERRLRELQA